MGLNLNDYKPAEEVIEFGDKKFIISAEIDDDIMERMAAAASLKWKEICKLYEDIMSIKNDRKVVQDFFKALKVPQKRMVMSFIGNYLKESAESMEKKS